MAVSGRKDSGFKDSLSIGSTEDFDVCCDPCKFLGKMVEAKGFCKNCQENLCKRCVDAHKSTKASRHHHLLDQPQKVTVGTYATSDDSKICTENCNIHKKEIIKFFCSQHDKVGCTDCITLDHRTCNIDYIQDVCRGMLKRKEFCETLQNVSKTLREFELMEQKARSKKTENKTYVEGVMEEIEKFQKKLNERIEQLKQELVKEANLHKSKQDQEIDKISDSCAGVYSELKQLHTALTDCQIKQLDAQAFITTKQAQWILNNTDVYSYEEYLTNKCATILFEPDNELENVLSQQYGLGRIVEPLSKVLKENKSNVELGKPTDASFTITQDSKTVLNCIKQKNSLNVRTESDENDCYITGCAVISADRLLLADRNNNKMKIVNTDTHSVVQELTMDSYPHDVTVLPRDQVAVTLPAKQKILILGTSGKLTSIRNMNLGRQCWGIDYHKDYLYVVCQQPDSLLILDMLGNVQRDIPLKTAQDQKFSNRTNIAVARVGHTIYISDSESSFVASLTLQGNVTGVYKHNEMNEPRGLVVLEDGSLLVCCFFSGTIHRISADLKQGRTVIRDVPNARSICCYPGNRQICVGAWGKDFSIYSYE